MSSHKKRRIEGVETPKPMSALSALAARRREAASSPAPAADTPSAEDDKPIISTANFFSPLQKVANKPKPPASPGKGTPKSARQQRGQESLATRRKGIDSPSGDLDNESSEAVTSSQKITQFSSFRPTKRNHRIKNGGVAELRLEQSERFMVLGSFGIRVLHGEITMAGASLRASETIHWIHAPHCYAVPVLRSTENTGLELHPDPNAWGLRQLGRLSPLFRKMWNEPTDASLGKRSVKEATFQILYTSEDAPKRCIIQDLVSPPEWNKKLAALVSASRKKAAFSTLVCGPKSAGKSTFSRLLSNRLVSERNSSHTATGIALLDLDPGQPEYAPAGTLSLVHITQPNLSAPFTHPGAESSGNKIFRCHALASVTPASDPDLYLACAKNLYEEYCKTMPEAPLIINTPGWILGTGLDLLSEVIGQVNPDEVLYMSEEGPAETVDVLRSATAKAFTELPSQQSEFTSRTAAHLRSMQMMSYFHLDGSIAGNANDKKTATTRWNSSPLSAQIPFIVSYAPRNRGIMGFLSYDYQAPPELLADAVNGTVLAAVEVEDPKAFRGLLRAANPEKTTDAMHIDTGTKSASKPELMNTVEGLPFIPNYNDVTLDPKYSRAVGLVLLRGIDTKTRTLQLLTPIPSETIKEIMSKGRDIILVHGKFDTPNWAYTEDLYEQGGVEEGNEEWLDVLYEDTDKDEPGAEPAEAERISELTAIPWVEVLKGNEKRPVGSRVWRVRRDLGRNAGD